MADGAGRDSTARDSTARAGRRDGAGRDTSRRLAANTVQVHTGDWVVRLDQPFTALPRTVLAVQRYRADDPPPYDDTGWSLDRLRGVVAYTVADSAVLARPMRPLAADARAVGATTGSGATLAVAPAGDWRSAVLPWRLRGARVAAADTAFAAGGATFPAGTVVTANTPAARAAAEALGLRAVALGVAPNVRSHAVALPRVLFLHTWLETQNEGWLRHALDEMGVPFTYASTQRLAERGFLDRFDVVLFPHATGTTAQLVTGRPMVGPAIPWRRSATTPSFAGTPDSTDDMRPGMGYDGVAALRRFVERGGLLITEGNTARAAVELGFNPTVSVAATPRLVARGGIYRAQPVERTHPALYGYEAGPVAVYFNQAPVLAVQANETAAADARTRAVMQNVADSALLRETERQRARVVLRFDPNADSLLVSGQLENGAELAGKAAVVDAPLGRGHVLLFGIRPMWRYETQGSYAMVLNAMAHWNALDGRGGGAIAVRGESPAGAPGDGD